MSKQRIEVNVEPRTTGKSSSRALRVDRKVPAVIYGAIENKNVYVEENAVKKYNTRAYENALINLKSSDAKVNGIVVLMKDVSVHPLTRRPRHVDFFALDLKKAVRVSVEIRVEGKPVGLADGGLLNVVNRTIEVECLPNDIPEALVADVSALGVGDVLHLADIKVPANIKLISAPEMTIAVVNLLEEEAATPAPAAAAAAPAADAKAAPTADAKAAAKPAAPAKK